MKKRCHDLITLIFNHNQFLCIHNLTENYKIIKASQFILFKNDLVLMKYLYFCRPKRLAYANVCCDVGVAQLVRASDS